MLLLLKIIKKKRKEEMKKSEEITIKNNNEIDLPKIINSEVNLFDRKVQQAISEILSEILKKEGEIKNPIPLGSLYNLCKRMNINYSGA
jgi:hypothetical protein